MPEIDVTDVLMDTDIAGETFSVIRREEIVNLYGISTPQSKTIPNVMGSIQPVGQLSLMREEAYDAQAKTIKVFTTFRLRGVSKAAGLDYKPDLIFWNGDYYEVQMLSDWSSFGGGIIEVECMSIDYVDDAPRLAAPTVSRLDYSKATNSGWAKGNSQC